MAASSRAPATKPATNAVLLDSDESVDEDTSKFKDKTISKFLKDKY
jgi:hypothetical protein